jgi:hypothetical protein
MQMDVLVLQMVAQAAAEDLLQLEVAETVQDLVEETEMAPHLVLAEEAEAQELQEALELAVALETDQLVDQLVDLVELEFQIQ